MELPNTHYLNYNGSPILPFSNIDLLNTVVTALKDKLPEGVLSLTQAPDHHEDNYRCRIIPEVVEVLDSVNLN